MDAHDLTATPLMLVIPCNETATRTSVGARAKCWDRPSVKILFSPTPVADPCLSAARSVELVFFDDQSNPHNVPALYTKMIDVDKVYLLARTKHRVMYEATPRADGQRLARNGHDNVLAYL